MKLIEGGNAWKDSGGQRPLVAPATKLRANTVLSRLDDEDLSCVASEGSLVALDVGAELWRQGAIVTDVYFPISGIVGLSLICEEGDTSSHDIVGRRSAIGLAACLGEGPALDIATVILSGQAFKVPAEALRAMATARPKLSRLLWQDLAQQVSRLQVGQFCCLHHTVEQRIASLLLAMCDNTGETVVRVTQESLASMLGVQRTTVSTLAHRLKLVGAMRYLRGAIYVDRERLERTSCACRGWSATRAAT